LLSENKMRRILSQKFKTYYSDIQETFYFKKIFPEHPFDSINNIRETLMK